jgi:hypothetical protein
MPPKGTNQHQSGCGSRRRTRGRALRAAIALGGTGALMLGTGAGALASSNVAHAKAYKPAITVVAVTPGPYDVAGAGGVFNVDLALLARNAKGNDELSAANGYKPGVNLPPAAGIGKPDPFAPGLVVLLSTTPKAAGGPNANLAGVFQLTDVVRSHGLKQVIADWEVGKPGAFGTGNQTTLTAYVVSGTAPGIITKPQKTISNVLRETFTIGS